MTEYTTFDYVWRVVLKVDSKDQRKQTCLQYTLTEKDKNRFLGALVGEGNPRCLKQFLLKSKNPAAANLNLHNAEFMPGGRFRLTVETQTRNITLLQQYDVETCVYQCLKENNCWDLLLCTETGGILYPEELLKEYQELKDDTKQYCKPDKVKVRDFVWDVNLKKKSGAPMIIPKTEIPIFRDILKEGLKQHANHCKNKTFELFEISLEDIEHGAKLIVTLKFLVDEKNVLQTTIDTIEKWISSSFRQKGRENVIFFYDEESAGEREVATNNPGSEVGVNLDNSQTSYPFFSSHEERLTSTYSSKSEATFVATAGVSAITDQKTPTKASSHFTSHVDRDRMSDGQLPHGTKKSDVTGGVSSITPHDEIGTQPSKGTDVDNPGGLKLKDLKIQYFTIEWELLYNERYKLTAEEETRCKAALHNDLNNLLKEETMQDVRYDCITVTETSLEIRFAVNDLSRSPIMDVLSTIVKRCFDKHSLSNLTVKKGKYISRFPMQAAREGTEITFCLYVPEDLAKEIKSIELSSLYKMTYSSEMKRKGTMWKTSIVFPEAKGEILYNYKLQIKKTVLRYFSKVDEVVDRKQRSICWGNIQRDILSLTSEPFVEKDKDRGIAAHIQDILQEPAYKIQTSFLEIDSLMSRNTLKCLHWNGAFINILNEQITEHICFLLLHCTQRKYVTSELFKNMNTATKIWETVQHIGQDSKDVCIKFVGEIFQIYEASSTTKCSPLHFINDTQPLLDIPSLHKVLLSRPYFPVHNCSESISCLQRALTFILSQDGENKMLHDLVCLVFDCIPEREVLEGFMILKTFSAPEEKKELSENTQKHVLANIEKIMTRKIKSLNLRAISDIISKTEGDLKIALVSHCEMEIVSQIKNPENFRYSVWNDLEDLCKENMLFQTTDQQRLLLDAVLKMPSIQIPRTFIKFVLTNFHNIWCESAKETLENAYEVLLSTVHGTSVEAKLISYFEEYDSLSKKCFSQTNREHFERRFRSHVSVYPNSGILKIHADVENLQTSTVDLYCHLLKGQLKNQTFLTKFDFFEKHWKSLDTRGIAQVFISSLENCKVDPTSSEEDLIDHAIKNVRFWTYILGAEGKQKIKIEKHPMYLLMKRMYVEMFTNLQNDQYDYLFLQKLKGDSERKLVDVFVLVVEGSKSHIQDSFKKALNFVDRACKDIELITNVCAKVTARLPMIYHEVLDETTQYLRNIQDNLRAGMLKFREFKDLGIFKSGDMESEKNLLESCKDIEQFLPIDSFWSNIEVFFHHQMSDVLEEGKQKFHELTSEKQTQLLLGFLSTFCISNFKERMRRLLNDDVPIPQLFQLFFKKDLTAKHLSLELDQIAKLIGYAEFPYERTKAIIQCLDLNRNSEKIAALRKFQSAVCSEIDNKCQGQIQDFEEIQTNYAESRWSMLEAYSFIMDMESSVLNFSADVMAVMIEYSISENLISFLREIMEEDIRNLMDAVEGEYFDQYLPLVSHLVEVKELLLPVLKLPKGTDITVYTSKIENSLQKTEIQKAAAKIAQCSKELDSLKNFYKAFANKTEKTKDRIENILDKGKFHFKLSEKECTVEILCIDDTMYTASDLSDLRSRALLIQSRFDKKLILPSASSTMTKTLSFFLEKVDAATEILETYQRLKMLGHPLFEIVDSNVEMSDLEWEKAHLRKICDEWGNDLDEYRQRFSCLKYIKSEQLQLLFKYTKSFAQIRYDENQTRNRADIKSVLWYLHPDLEFSMIDEGCISGDDSPRQNLDMVVHCLEDNFMNLKPRGQVCPITIKADSSNIKFSKNLNFICVDKDSGVGPNLILGWFLMKCNTLPLPSQVVVCNENTSWDELYLLLLRSRERPNAADNCFCIAFLELLSVENQGMLIHEIEKFDWNNSSLSLIYRGRQTDSIPTLFKDCEIFMQPFDRKQMESLLQTMFPKVMVFTSDSPGLGKTEQIRDLAASFEKGVKSLHISGANRKLQLIQRLKELDLKPYELLHIEIGLAERPEELDIFLFELVILRYVSFSSLSYVLPETLIALEITNCPSQMMVNGMPFSICFSRKHLKWENYENYKCQQVPNSPVQVACAYLSRLETGDLNADIDLSKTELQNENKCQLLLRKYFPSFDGINFTIVDAFVSVLGNQLKKFSASTYFKTTNLTLMIGEDNTSAVRKIVLESLIQFSKEFASRSIASCRDLQHRTFENFNTPLVDLKKAVLNLARRTEGMIRWENSNHLIVVFHSQDTQTVSAVYRCLENVPHNIEEMFESQIQKDLPNYATMESEKLLEVIVKITRTKQKQLSKEHMSTLAQGYAYTPDNMLKMMMISLRLQSNIPVVVMGETGCGKTSLIRRLADICEVHLNVLSVHAGIREKDILDIVLSANNIAESNRREEVWLFFDELNTSEHVGLISHIVCHRELHGDAFSPNLSFIAACNPYRLRESNRYTKGLKGKLSEDALSLLAYRVHPLPEMMLDFVWDYGSLPLKEERAYIQRMVDTKIFQPDKDILLIHLLAASQQFVREKEGSSCTVSLRDVYRCISLIKWFKDQFIPQQHPDMEETEVIHRSFIMGLTICYLCRFSNSNDRLAYRERLSAVFSSNFIDTYSEKKIAQYIREEHNAILDRMDIPKGTARNTALQENIFVMLVCILNKLPLFIVGKPGCSKSLSMQLIRNNMRGKDSKDQFFQKYPRLFYSSFQGSESSTSDGIIKVFERAKKFEKQDSDVLSLVILDEIGLAEISRFNPLKVLHSLLEPEGRDRPEVAVVGISNWSLDSAKMNRAIHLSRPDMDEEELFITGQSIMESVAGHISLDSILKDIAKAYSDYVDQQPIKNFHGLRDYYSFVKYISRKFENMNHAVNEVGFFEEKRKLLLKGMLRNFGGQQMNNDTMRRTFFHRMLLQDLPICETKELIKENIMDSEARHLMLILDGDSALGSIENIIENIGKDFTTILGSRFPDDEDDEYNYRVLNRIILCMEQPQVLILKDLDDIYGSLYDMLNQNYTIVQGKKHCRVALGPFSNPTCEVNDDFKCIVVIDESNITNTDPPFLNRFEKQQYLLRDILKPNNVRLAEYVECFVNDLSSYRESNILFSAQDSFPVAGKEMFTSLVTLVEQKLASLYGKSTSTTEVLYYCILELLWILKPDCIFRANISDAWTKSRNSVKFLIAMYMTLPIHNGLGYYLQEVCDAEELFHGDVNRKQESLCRLVPFELKELRDTYLRETEDDDSIFDDLQEYYEENASDSCETSENEWHAPFEMEENLDFSDNSSDIYLENVVHETGQRGFSRKKIHYQQIQSLRKTDGYGAKLVVFTFSTIYCKIQDALANIDYSLHKLSEYKTEKNFSKDIEQFFESSKRKWFVLQCDMKSDYHHILLAKSIVENSRKRLTNNDKTKHVCFVIHITRNTNPFHMFNKINFSSGWTLATLDAIEKPIFVLPDLYNKPALDVLGANEQEFAELIVKELPWASAKIQYQGTSDNITDVQTLKKSECALEFVSEQIQAWIRRHSDIEDNMDWQHKAACDKHLLETSATLIGTLESHLSSLIQKPLGRILYSIESAGLMSCLLSFDDLKPELKDVFRKGCECQDLYNVDAVPPPAGPGCYLINLSHNHMKVPFSKLIFENLENYKAEVLGDVRRTNIIPGHLQVADDEELKETMLAIVRAYSDLIKKETNLFDVLTFDHIVEDLRNDFCQFATSTIKCRLSGEEKANLMKWILNRLTGNNVIYDVGTFLMTLHLWTWTYFQNIIGIFHLVDSWKTRDKCNNALSNLLYRSENEKTLLESLQTFVDSICEDILSQCVELKRSEIIEWQEGVFKFMTIIGEIGITSHKTETLKFFNDFVSVVFIPTKCDSSHLNQFAMCVSSCNWDLNKLSVFESLWNHLKLLSERVSALELQQIACSFISRCNGINVNDDLEQKQINLKAVDIIANGEMFDESLKFYNHCLKLSLVDYFPDEEEDFDSSLFLQMLENDISKEDLDDYLYAIHNLLDEENKTAFPLLFLSTLEEEVFNEVIGIEKLTNIATHNDVLLRKLFQAQDALRSQCTGMRHSAAVAYLKTFLSVTASLLFTASYRNKFVLSAIDQLMCSGTKSNKQVVVQKYFLDCLKRRSGDLELLKLSAELSETMQFFRTSSLLPSVENIGCSLESLNLARYCVIPDLILLQSLSDISEDAGFLKRLIDREKTSVASLLCFLHSRLFYVECFTKVADSDRLLVESFEKADACVENDRVQQLIKHLTFQRDCKRDILRQRVQKSAEGTSLTSFLIHVVSLILIHESKSSTLYKAAIYHEVSECTQIERKTLTTFQIRTCTCSHRVITSEKLSCPWCSSSNMSEHFNVVFQPVKTEPFSSFVRNLLIDAALVTSCLFQDVVSEVGSKEVESREKSFQINWQKLREYLQVNDSEQCQLLMIFLENVKEIFSDSTISKTEWNPKYDDELRKVLQNRYRQMRMDNIRHDTFCKALRTTVVVENAEETENVETGHIFFLSEKPSIHNLYLELHMSKSEEKHPCLNMILESLEMLQFPQYIEGILQWHRLLITRCSYSLKKVDCKYMSVGSFINQQNREIQRDLRESFKIFSDKWGEIVTLIARLEYHTTKLPCVEKITEDSKMDFCVLKDKTSTVFQVLHVLCSLQNKLLDKILEICVLFECKALGFLHLGPKQAAIPVVAFMDLQTKHIVKSIVEDNAEKLELFSQVGCTANTRGTDYDFRKIEIEWAFKVFYNKAYILIDETMMFMEFKDDLYGHCVQLLQKVSALIPQTTIDSAMEEKIKERLENDSSQGPQLLTLIGTMTTIIVRRKATEGRLHMAEYAGRLEGLQLIGLSNSSLLPFTEYDLTLNKVVPFYTLLEEINGEKYINALDIEFRDAMQDKTKQQIIHEVSGRITLLRTCESAMHVFLHRYLYIRDNDISLQQPIADYLSSTELWKNAQILNQRIILPNLDFEILLQDVFPQELLIRHVYKFIELLKEQIRLHQIKTRIPKLSQRSRKTNKRIALAGNF